MIKSLFDHDDEPKSKTSSGKVETEESIRRELEELNHAAEPRRTEPVSEQEVRQIFSKIIELPPAQIEPKIVEEPREAFPEIFETQSEIRQVEPLPDSGRIEPPVETPPQTHENSPRTPLDRIFSNYAAEEPKPAPQTPPETVPPSGVSNEPQTPSFFQNAEPQSLSTAETLRQSGLAWSAAIGLFGSVVFMLILGWIFDTLTGASPYGIIIGIVIGAGIGFYQFFRVTSQIFKK